MELVREYVACQSEQAFEALVSRHVGLVHSAALRQVGDPSLAEEITQTVFIILARKAGSLNQKTILPGWLYRTTRYVSAAALKIHRRRERRELEAHMQAMIERTQTDSAWEQFAPMLDEAMAQLRDSDRDAIVLRYFQNKSLRDVGAMLGVDESVAQKRVGRAVEKLRSIFAKRGIVSTAAIITGAISANSAQAAPVAPVTSVTTVAIAKGASASGSTLTLIKGALKLMAWTKAKTAIVAGVVLLFAVGTTTVTVKEIQAHRTYPWQVSGFNGQRLNQAAPQVAILRSKIASASMGNNTPQGNSVGKMMGTGVSAQSVVQAAYGMWSSTGTVFLIELPKGRFDFISSLPSGNEEALQQEVKQKFGAIAKKERREADVLLLKVNHSDAPGLKRGTAKRVSVNEDKGRLSCVGCTLDSLAANLEPILNIPILNQSGLAGNFDIDLKWDATDWQHRNPDALKQSLLDQLGLELVPSHEPIEMLTVEKVK